jgi:uncharacterized protein YcfL
MRQWKLALFVTALLVGGCSGSSQGAGNSDWMDSATVVVAQNVSTARETVTLIDPVSGTSALVDDEPLIPDVSEVVGP